GGRLPPLQGFQGFHFRRGNVPFVLAATFRARLFLFPVDCSLFPLYYPLLFHQQLDKSVFTSLLPRILCDRLKHSRGSPDVQVTGICFFSEDML
ncbi:MAG: hypothetical protein IJH03_04890, partial [Clostridia bacterium]|nr:hypothetical protein [Clostridia bacterium]